MKPLSNQILDNLAHVYSLRTPESEQAGIEWYGNANLLARTVAREGEISLGIACGVIAALSPGNSWERNVTNSADLAIAFRKNKPIPTNLGVYGTKNVTKALRVLNGEEFYEVVPPTSPKFRNFYECINNPRNKESVCIDRHAKAAALNLPSNKKGSASNDSLSVVRPREYEWLAEHYRIAAAKVNLLPCEYQGVVWLGWKKLGMERGNDN